MRNASAKAVLLLLGGTIVLAVLTLVWAIGAGSSEAQQGDMHNCPQPGKWAISVWGGADGTETGEALAACGQDAVEVAYYIDPDTQQWLGYFAGHADISQLLALNGKQGVIARGAAAATSGSLAVPGATYVGTTSQGLAIEFEMSADGLAIRKVKYRVSGTEPGGGTCDTFTTSTLGPSTVGTAIVDNSFAIVHTQFDMSGHFEMQWQATGELTVHEPQADNVPPCDAGPLTWTATIPSATPTAVPAGPGQMHNCPQAGKWAISVWDGPDGTETGEALATCGVVPVIAAYYLDPATNGWQGYFDGQPEATKLLTVNNMQGVIAHGAMGTPAPTPTPTATPGTAGDVVLVSSNAFTTTTPFFLIDGESRRMHIVGELRNDSATPRSAGKITTTIYDAANNVVGSRWNYACDNIIMPGRTTAFAVTYPSLFYSSDETNYFPEGWTRYEITLSPRDPYDWEDKPVDIAVENVQVSEGGLHVTGNAVNSSSKTVDTYDVKVYVIYYRADGAILNVGAEWAVNDQPLGPGQSTSFDIIFASDEPLDFSSYVVQAYAEAE